MRYPSRTAFCANCVRDDADTLATLELSELAYWDQRLFWLCARCRDGADWEPGKVSIWEPGNENWGISCYEEIFGGFMRVAYDSQPYERKETVVDEDAEAEERDDDAEDKEVSEAGDHE